MYNSTVLNMVSVLDVILVMIMKLGVTSIRIIHKIYLLCNILSWHLVWCYHILYKYLERQFNFIKGSNDFSNYLSMLRCCLITLINNIVSNIISIEETSYLWWSDII